MLHIANRKNDRCALMSNNLFTFYFCIELNLGLAAPSPQRKTLEIGKNECRKKNKRWGESRTERERERGTEKRRDERNERDKNKEKGEKSKNTEEREGSKKR